MDPHTPEKKEMVTGADYIDPMHALMDDSSVDGQDQNDGEDTSYVAPDLDQKPATDTTEPDKPDPKKDTPIDDKPDNVETDEVVPLVFGVLKEKWGLEIPEANEPKTIEEFTEFMDEFIEANTQHRYYNEDAEQYDLFLKNGGDPRIFLQATGAQKMVELLDPEDEKDAETGLLMYFEKKGLDADDAKKQVDKSKKLGELIQDAKEAMPKLQKITALEKEQAIKRQEQEHKEQLENVRKYNESLIDGVKSVKSIMGIELTDKHRSELLPYITQRDANGLTPLLKDYYADPAMFNIVTAFAYKNRDKIMELMGAPAKSDAIKTFREKQKALLTKTRTLSDTNPADDDDDQFMRNAKRVDKRD